jgi:twitching motility protein PilT
MTVTSHDDLAALLRAMQPREASDLHLVPGNPPMYRIHGRLEAAGQRALAAGEVLAMLRALLPAGIAAGLEGKGDLDFALQLPGGPGALRFRVNVFSGRGERGACFRAIPGTIPRLEELGFPADLAARITGLNGGLVLVTGVTGSGKTTTLACLVQAINARGGQRIITIEEPIEYVYPPSPGGLVTQREVGADVVSFFDGLRSGLRQDPDVLLVGEIRDRETAALAISAAETGHLIFASLHTMDAKGAITRLVDLFPTDVHEDIRTQLSLSLRFVVAQHLLPARGGGRRVLALEVMSASFPVRAAIRQGKIEALESAIQSGRKEGMWSLDADLQRLLSDGRISLETAREWAKDPEEFG